MPYASKWEQGERERNKKTIPDDVYKVLLVPNELSSISWRCIAEWRYSSTFLDLGTGWG
jgi:hypothetical protein